MSKVHRSAILGNGDAGSFLIAVIEYWSWSEPTQLKICVFYNNLKGRTERKRYFRNYLTTVFSIYVKWLIRFIVRFYFGSYSENIFIGYTDIIRPILSTKVHMFIVPFIPFACLDAEMFSPRIPVQG